MLTSGQLTLTTCLTELTCDEVQLGDDGETWEATKCFRPRFLPQTTVPQSYEAKAECQELMMVPKMIVSPQVRGVGFGSRHHESRPMAEARLDLEVSAGWTRLCKATLP